MRLPNYFKSGIHQLRRTKLFQQIPDFYWVDKVIQFHLNPSEVHYDSYSNELFLEEFGITLQKGKDDFFLSALNFARNLKNLARAEYKKINGEILIFIENISLIIQTWEEFYILNEIFIEGIYNLITPKEVVILDIGMNTGFASLFFANKPYVKSVISFEPVEVTYKQAQKNLLINPDIAEKIKTYNFGLSNSNETLTVDYCYASKGSVGINGLQGWVIGSQNMTKVNLELMNVCDVIENSLREYVNEDIIAKIDCEGAEYKIIDALCTTGKIGYLNGILLEWHDYQQTPALIEQLLKAGFKVVSLNPYSKTFGMLYAFRI